MQINKIKRLSIVGTAGFPAQYGGFETLAENLALNLQNKYKITVFCSSLIYKKRPSKTGNIRLIYFPFKANGWGSVPYDILSLIYSVFISDTILILGASGCIVLPLINLFFRKKIIFNVDGLEVERCTYKSLSKKFSVFSEKIAVKQADILVSDNEAISKSISKFFKRESFFIPYGGDHSFKVIPSSEDIQKHPFLSEKYACIVSRIVPDNSIEIILEVFRCNKEKRIVIVGNWFNSNYGKNLYNHYNSLSNIIMLDAIYDRRELNLIRSNCIYYINGHAAGGTPPSLTEAMCLGLPVIAYKSPSNLAATENKAFYFNSVDTLSDVIQKTTSIELNILKQNMLEIAERKYKWEKIIEAYDNIF